MIALDCDPMLIEWISEILAKFYIMPINIAAIRWAQLHNKQGQIKKQLWTVELSVEWFAFVCGT